MNTYLFTSPKFIPLTPAQALMPNSYLQFYLTGTTTPVDVYADADLNTPLSNPVEADSAGVFPFIYMDPEVTYRVQFYNADHVEIWDVDPYTPPRDYAPGTVLMFMGTAEQLEAAYPSTLWQVCDGTNGTYDLRGRIPIGVSSDIDPGEEVGSAPGSVTTDPAGEHSHGGTSGSTAITEANLPSHYHLEFADVEGSSSTLPSASNSPDRGTSAGGDTEYIMRSSGLSPTVGKTSSVGSGTGHTHTIPTQADHTHTVDIALPPATGIWFVMRRS